MRIWGIGSRGRLFIGFIRTCPLLVIAFEPSIIDGDYDSKKRGFGGTIRKWGRCRILVGGAGHGRRFRGSIPMAALTA
jgi:hypothetical protein